MPLYSSRQIRLFASVYDAKKYKYLMWTKLLINELAHELHGFAEFSLGAARRERELFAPVILIPLALRGILKAACKVYITRSFNNRPNILVCNLSDKSCSFVSYLYIC